MTELKPSFCRLCLVNCPVIVETDGRRVVAVKGDRTNAITGGYACSKGRTQADLYNRSDRVLRCLKRREDGSFEQISSNQAIDEIAERLEATIAAHGPRAVAAYFGTFAATCVTATPFLDAFMNAIGSPMKFSASTIDKPGKFIARAALGQWMAPFQGYDNPNVGILVGLNPFVSLQGLPNTNPGKWLGEAQARGFKLIVIDPRSHEVARRAFLHLQVRPGHDVPVLAAILRVIVEENLFDAKFVAENVQGFESLVAAVSTFDVVEVARRAGLSSDDLLLAARTFATGGRGYLFCGTGPNFSATGTLVEYLGLCIMTVCGYVMRAGEIVRNPGTAIPSLTPKAQAKPPRSGYGFGEKMRVRGLANTAAGLPTAALADEILLDGPGQVKALISCGGNPINAWPDQLKTFDALKKLDLLVQVDPWMSGTAKLSHYVIPPPIGLEVAAVHMGADIDVAYNLGYGREQSWGHYTPAIVDPPDGAELIEEWELFYGLAKRMGRPLVLRRHLYTPLDPPVAIDMKRKLSSDEALEAVMSGSRVSLEELKRYPHGSEFPGDPVIVAPKEPDWTGRLDVGNVDMIRDLDQASSSLDDDVADQKFDLRLLCRRATHVYNSSYNFSPTNHGRPFNPAFMHPDELIRRGMASGDPIRIESARSAIIGVVMADNTLRPGVVSMTHGYGGLPTEDDRYLEIGSPTGRLIFNDQEFDRYSGQPLMTNVPVRVVALAHSDDDSPEPD